MTWEKISAREVKIFLFKLGSPLRDGWGIPFQK